MHFLKIGDTAPDFSGLDQNGSTVRLSDFSGKTLVLYFYPKDNTPGCTVQACNLRDNFSELVKQNISVLGVSADSMQKHQKFIDKYALPFPLIADENHELLKNYGVWGLKKFMGREYDGIHRTTFIINKEGIIDEIIKKPKTKFHAQEILDFLNK
ncbi:MAG: thioredoxin-dependent thiol peroxidase [Crocinitomicaceae bacterium]|nr:thioredoxin-dependent thiol peroxidase [Crocinitomicaceae bacterium]